MKGMMKRLYIIYVIRQELTDEEQEKEAEMDDGYHRGRDKRLSSSSSGWSNWKREKKEEW